MNIMNYEHRELENIMSNKISHIEKYNHCAISHVESNKVKLL